MPTYQPNWQAIMLMKRQNNRDNNKICWTIGEIRAFIFFYLEELINHALRLPLSLFL